MRQLQPVGHALGAKIAVIKPERERRGSHHEDEPRKVGTINNAHRLKKSEIASVGVVRFVTRSRLPGLTDQFALSQNRVAEKFVWIHSLGRVVWTGIDAARSGKLRAQVAGVRL